MKSEESANNLSSNQQNTQASNPSISIGTSESLIDDSIEESKSEEIEYSVNYNENMAADSESVPALVLINGAHKDGGFRVVPAEDRSNRSAEMFCILWKDSDDVECFDPKTVMLGNEQQALVKFVNEADF